MPTATDPLINSDLLDESAAKPRFSVSDRTIGSLRSVFMITVFLCGISWFMPGPGKVDVELVSDAVGFVHAVALGNRGAGRLDGIAGKPLRGPSAKCVAR